MDVPLGRRRGVAGDAVGAAHQHPAAEEPRQVRLALERDGEVRERAERHERDLARPARAVSTMTSAPCRSETGRRRRRQLRVAEPVRPVRLGRRLEGADERLLAPERHLDVVAARQLQHGPRVLVDLARIDVARQHVTASSSASGEAQAYSRARLSSIPVSTSSRRGTRGVTAGNGSGRHGILWSGGQLRRTGRPGRLGRRPHARPTTVIPFLVAALTILGLFTTAPDAVAAGKKSPMIVVLDRDADVDAAVKRGKGDHGVKPTNVFKHAARGYAADLNPGQVRAIERDRSVMGVIPDSVVELVAQVTPPGVRRVRATSSPLTHINRVDLASHRVNADVAIIDTGIQPDHPDLRVVGGYDCTRPGTRTERSRSSRWRDDHGHGTHVAGIVGALDNTRGVVGVAPGVRLWSVRVFTATGYSRLSWIACGIDWVTSKRDPNNSARPLIEVANMSLRDKGTDDRNCGYSVIDIEHQAICRSTARGTLYVVAAGNNSNVAGNWRPASYNEVVTVSAMADYDGKPGGLASAPCVAFGRRDSDDTFADFSNYGLDIDVVAPGVCVRSTYRGSTYATVSGTSMATPHVAGAAALFLVAHPGTPPADVRSAIRAAGAFDWRTSSDRDSTSIRCSTCPRSGRVPACACAPPRPRSGCETGRAARP